MSENRPPPQDPTNDPGPYSNSYPDPGPHPPPPPDPGPYSAQPPDPGPYPATPTPVTAPPAGSPTPPAAAPGAPPPAGPPPGYHVPAASGGSDKAMVFGIIGIIVAVICCAPLGILFGYLSMQEAKKTGRDQTLGKVAFWLGIAMTAVSVIAAILWICVGVGTLSFNNNRYEY